MTDPAKTPEKPPPSVVRFWSAAGWGVVLLVGFIAIELHGRTFAHGREQFVALKMLQTNHRLVEGDIAEAGLWHPFLYGSLTTRDDFNGRYVKDCVDDQDPIEIEKTASGPEIVTEKDTSMVWIPLSELPAADVATLDVRRELDVCNLDGNEACGGAYRVQAIACAGKTMAAETCSAGVQINADQRRRLLAALDEADAARKPEPTSKPEASPKPEATPNPAGIAAKARRIPTIHVMIHRSADRSKPTTAAARKCQASSPSPTPHSSPTAVPSSVTR